FSTAPPPPPTSPLSLHDALPISIRPSELRPVDLKRKPRSAVGKGLPRHRGAADDSGAPLDLGGIRHFEEQHLGASRSQAPDKLLDRKSTRLNSSHVKISYAVFCL